MTLNIELPNQKIMRLLKTKSGDVIFSFDERDQDDRPIEKLVATIPENRRDIIADFLKGR